MNGDWTRPVRGTHVVSKRPCWSGGGLRNGLRANRHPGCRPADRHDRVLPSSCIKASPSTTRRFTQTVAAASGLLSSGGTRPARPRGYVTSPERRRLASFTHRKTGQSRSVMEFDDTLVEKVERLVDASGRPLRWTSSTTVVIAQLVERIESLEAAVREIADVVGAATEADHSTARAVRG